jgi:hypothetical protein
MSKSAPEFALNSNGTHLKVRKTRLMEKLQIFLDDPALFSEPKYYVRSIVDPAIFTDFVKSVQGEPINITTANFGKLVGSFRDFIVLALITPILKHLRESPAVQYVSGLGRLSRCLSVDFIKQTIFRMLLEFIKMGENHRYAAGEILLILSFAVLDLSNCDFLSVLTSSVVVTLFFARHRPNCSSTRLELAGEHSSEGIVTASEFLSAIERRGSTHGNAADQLC